METKKKLRLAAWLALVPLLLLVLELLIAPKLGRSSLAELLFKRNAINSAAELYKKNLSGSEDDSVALANYAKTLYKKGEYSAAQDSLRRVLEHENPGTDLLYDMGNIAFQQEKYQEALDFYKQALLRNPEDYELKANYELALRKLNQDQPPQQKPENEEEQQEEQPESSDLDDIRNLLDALDQKESLDRQNQEKDQDGGVRNWW
ncbi:MAG: tetratricopeptide repeat protein [Candidatus Cloacimonadota bacterium]